MIRKIQHIALVFWIKFRVGLLYMLNLILIRRLKVIYCDFSDAVLISGNFSAVNFLTKGCYKITIQGLGEMEGSAKSFPFLVPEESKSFVVTFHGIRKKRTVQLECNPTHLTLMQEMGQIELKTPNLHGAEFSSMSIGIRNIKFHKSIEPQLLLGSSGITMTLPKFTHYE